MVSPQTPNQQAPDARPAPAPTMSPRLLLRLRFVAANDNHPASVQDSGRWLGISAALALLAGLLAHFLI